MLYRFGLYVVCVLRGTAYFSRRYLVWPRARYITQPELCKITILISRKDLNWFGVTARQHNRKYRYGKKVEGWVAWYSARGQTRSRREKYAVPRRTHTSKIPYVYLCKRLCEYCLLASSGHRGEFTQPLIDSFALHSIVKLHYSKIPFIWRTRRSQNSQHTLDGAT